MASSPLRWYIRAQLGILLLPAGLCLLGEAVSRRTLQMAGGDGGPWWWYGTLSLILINAGVGLMIESGLLRGYPKRGQHSTDDDAEATNTVAIKSRRSS